MTLYNKIDLRIKELESEQRNGNLPRSERKYLSLIIKELKALRRGS